MFRQSLLMLIFVAICPLYGEEPQPDNKPQVPVVQKLVAEQAEVDLELREKAPPDRFEKGTCLIVTGLIQIANADRLNDFRLERQVFATLPADPDAAEWKSFDLADTIKVISASTSFQVDRLPLELTNPVVTQPLPYLKTAEWPAAVIHPELRKSLQDPPENTVQLRVLDFDTKPKHYYRYRVRLVIANDAGRAVQGEWSKPSKLISVESPAPEKPNTETRNE